MVVSQGGFGSSTSAVGVSEIYSAIYGVTRNQINKAEEIFPNGIPNKLPKIDHKNAKLVLP